MTVKDRYAHRFAFHEIAFKKRKGDTKFQAMGIKTNIYNLTRIDFPTHRYSAAC